MHAQTLPGERAQGLLRAAERALTGEWVGQHKESEEESAGRSVPDAEGAASPHNELVILEQASLSVRVHLWACVRVEEASAHGRRARGGEGEEKGLTGGAGQQVTCKVFRLRPLARRQPPHAG